MVEETFLPSLHAPLVQAYILFQKHRKETAPPPQQNGRPQEATPGRRPARRRQEQDPNAPVKDNKYPLKKFIVSVGNALAMKYHSLDPAANPEPTAAPAAAPPPAAAPAPVANPAPANEQPNPAHAKVLFAPESRLSSKGMHFPKILGTSAAGNKLFRRCFVCNQREKVMIGVKARQTSMWCTTCGKPLCVDKVCQGLEEGKDATCYEIYHSIMHFEKYK